MVNIMKHKQYEEYLEKFEQDVKLWVEKELSYFPYSKSKLFAILSSKIIQMVGNTFTDNEYNIYQLFDELENTQNGVNKFYIRLKSFIDYLYIKYPYEFFTILNMKTFISILINYEFDFFDIKIDGLTTVSLNPCIHSDYKIVMKIMKKFKRNFSSIMEIIPRVAILLIIHKVIWENKEIHTQVMAGNELV